MRTGGEEEEERRATWLALFFDLIFVVAIAELGHLLSDEVSILGELKGKTAIAFALCYAAFRAILVIQYLNAGYHVKSARPHHTTSARLCDGTDPLRYGLWGLGLLIDLATPVLAQKYVLLAPPSFSHITERVGLFIIIVLGESFWAVIQSVSNQVWTFNSVVTALLRLSIAYSFWWIYFDSVNESPLKSIRAGKPHIALMWLYAHLPLAIGLGATGIGVKSFIKSANKGLAPTGDHYLLGWGVILCLVSLALIHYITCTLGAEM